MRKQKKKGKQDSARELLSTKAGTASSSPQRIRYTFTFKALPEHGVIH